MHQKPFFNYVANLPTGNLILESEQMDNLDRDSPNNRVYNLKYCPIEDVITLFDPLKLQDPPKQFREGNCNNLINLLLTFDRVRLMCWCAKTQGQDHSSTIRTKTSDDPGQDDTLDLSQFRPQVGQFEQNIAKDRVEENRQNRRGHKKDIKSHEREERDKMIDAVMLLTQLKIINANELNKKLQSLEHKYPQAQFRFPTNE